MSEILSIATLDGIKIVFAKAVQEAYEAGKDFEQVKENDYVVPLPDADEEYEITNSDMQLGQFTKFGDGGFGTIKVIKHKDSTEEDNHYPVRINLFRKATQDEIVTGLGKQSVDEPEAKNTEKPHTGIGERILIIKPQIADGQYRKGDIGTVKKIQSTCPKGVWVNEWSQFVYEEEYEVIIEELVPIKSPNQQRKELIHRAREFWDENADDEFHCEVDKEKRTVFVYKVVSNVFGGYGAVTGLAVFRTDEVFNEFIGMAIALARALKIDIPQEFIDAVQPDEFVVGMKVYCDDKAFGDARESTRNVMGIERGSFSDGILVDAFNSNRLDNYTWVKSERATIIDDTIAVYDDDAQ